MTTTTKKSNYEIMTNNHGEIARIDVEHALPALMFCNFEGRETRDRNTGRIYNKEGDQNFCIAIPEELAADLTAEGWNVKVYTDADGESVSFLKVKINWHPSKPEYIPEMYTSTNRNTGERKKTPLDEETSKLINVSTLKDIDVSIRRGVYKDDDGNWKPTPRLAGAWATISQSYLADKWNDDNVAASDEHVEESVPEEDYLPFS
jgi:hypothetical protein